MRQPFFTLNSFSFILLKFALFPLALNVQSPKLIPPAETFCNMSSCPFWIYLGRVCNFFNAFKDYLALSLTTLKGRKTMVFFSEKIEIILLGLSLKITEQCKKNVINIIFCSCILLLLI